MFRDVLTYWTYWTQCWQGFEMYCHPYGITTDVLADVLARLHQPVNTENRDLHVINDSTIRHEASASTNSAIIPLASAFSYRSAAKSHRQGFTRYKIVLDLSRHANYTAITVSNTEPRNRSPHIMSRQTFQTMRRQSGTYTASLCAAACHIPLAVVQLWLRATY